MNDYELITGHIEAFRRSKTMFVAASMEIFDRVPATAERLAEAIPANLAALTRVLDACVGIGLLRRDGDIYSNSAAAGTYLRRSSPQTLYGYVVYSERVLYPMWQHLDDAVKEGTHRWKQTFGSDGPIF